MAQITIFDGQIVDIELAVTGLDITGADLRWLFAQSAASVSLAYEYGTSPALGSRVAIIDADTARVRLTNAETADLQNSLYHQEWWVVDAQGEANLLASGAVTIAASLADDLLTNVGETTVVPVRTVSGQYQRDINLSASLAPTLGQRASIPSGASMRLVYTVSDVVLTGMRLRWLLAGTNDAAPLIEYTTDNRIAIEAADRCVVTILTADTVDLAPIEPASYKYQLWLVNPSGEQTILADGTFVVSPSLYSSTQQEYPAQFLDPEYVQTDSATTGVIATFTASGGRPDSYTYTLAGADAGSFTIDANTGALSIPTALAAREYQIDIVVTNVGAGGNMTAIFARDVFVSQAEATVLPAQTITPTDISIYSYQTGEIATFVASGGNPDRYTWSLGGIDAAKFSINAATGVLSVPTALAAAAYSFTVTADNGEPATITVTVAVTAASVATAITGSTPAVTADEFDVQIQLAAEGAVPSVTGWSLSAGAPVSIDNAGLILVPGDIAIGVHTFDPSAINAAGTYTEPGATLTIDQWAPVASLDPASLPAIETTFTGTVATFTAFGQYPDDTTFSLTSPPAGFGVSGRNLTADGTQAAGTPTLSIRARNGYTNGVPDFDVTFSRPITVTALPAGDEFVDTFDGRTGQNLNVNTAWAQISGPADAAYTNSAGELVFNGSTKESGTYLAPNLGYNSHAVEIAGVYSTGVNTWSYLAQVCYRYENGSTVAWAGIRHILQNSVYELRLDVWNGALTTVAAYNVGGVLDNDTLRIEKKQLAGSVEISVYLDNVLVLGPWTSTDPKLQDNTRAGLSSRGTNARIGHYRHYEIGAAGTSFVADTVLHSYLMDEGSGQYVLDAGAGANDSVLGSTTGVDVNDPAWTATGLNFNADDLIASDVAHPGTAEFHLDLVVKWDTTQDLVFRVAYAHWAGTDSLSPVRVFTDGSGIIRAAFSSSGGNIEIPHSKPTGAHQHLQVWRDASKVYLAVDGAVRSAVPSGTAGTSSGTIYHGAKLAESGHMLGTSEVSISHRHGRSLTSAERDQNREHVISIMNGRGVTLANKVRTPVAALDFNMSDRPFSQMPGLTLVQGSESGRVVGNQGELYGTGGGYLHSTTALGQAQYVQAKLISVNAASGTTGYLQPLWARASADGAHGVVGRYYNGKYQIVKRINNAHTTVAEVAKAFVANGILRLEVRDMMSGSTWAGVEARLFLDNEMLMSPLTITDAVLQTALRAGIRGYDGGFFDDWEAGNLVDA